LATPGWMDDYVTFHTEKRLPALPPPKTLEEAKSREDWPEWYAAMVVEMQAIERLGMYSLVKRAPSMNVLKNKWIYAYKLDSAGLIDRYKARLVVKGFGQRYGIDYEQTFSPTPQLKAIRTLLGLAAVTGMHTHHIDISTAFLNGTLEIPVHMEQPAEFVSGN